MNVNYLQGLVLLKMSFCIVDEWTVFVKSMSGQKEEKQRMGRGKWNAKNMSK